MTDLLATLRFAVAAFDTSSGLRNALTQLQQEGLRSEAFNCLGLAHVLASTARNSLLPASGLRKLPFPENHPSVCCTTGLLADRLTARIEAGAPTLKAALSHWLIPRHAAQLQEAVQQARIVLWVRLLDSDSEHLAYRSLLASCSNSVGVHDLVAE